MAQYAMRQFHSHSTHCALAESTRRELSQLLFRLLICVRRSLIPLLRTAHLDHKLRCICLSSCLLTHSGAHRKEIYVYRMNVDFVVSTHSDNLANWQMSNSLLFLTPGEPSMDVTETEGTRDSSFSGCPEDAYWNILSKSQSNWPRGS